MLLPIGEPVDVPVELICTTRVPPLILRATTTLFDGTRYRVRLDDEGDALELGARVILEFGRSDSPRVLALVAEVDGSNLLLDVQQSRPRDKREFPRMYGGVELRYAVVAPQDTVAIDGWRNGTVQVGDDWHHPDPFMDFSASGLKFDDEETCKADDILLMDMSIPPSDESFRGVARVVRLFTIEEDDDPTLGEDRTGTHAIAVEFVHLPTAAVEALMQFTLRLQGAIL